MSMPDFARIYALEKIEWMLWFWDEYLSTLAKLQDANAYWFVEFIKKEYGIKSKYPDHKVQV